MMKLVVQILLCCYVSLAVSQDCQQRKYDFLILLDDSGSISPTNYVAMKQFLHDLVAKFTISPTDTRVGLIRFSSDDHLHWSFPSVTATSLSALQTAIQALPQDAGSTCIRCAIEGAFPVFQNDARPTVPWITFLLTDGVNNVGAGPELAAARLRGLLGVDVFAIGVSAGTNEAVLVNLAGGNSSRVIVVVNNDYSAVLNSALIDEITRRICEQITNQPEPETHWQCPTGKNKCFMRHVTDSSITWQDAENSCVNKSSHLVSIHSQEENDYVVSLLVPPAYGYSWIGGQRVNLAANFLWSDGTGTLSSPNYESWTAEAPDNTGAVLGIGDENCAEMYLPNARGPIGEWNDIPCNIGEVKNYVCAINDALCGKRGFHNIATMTNTPGAVDWALDKGANGLSIDLRFDAGNVVNFKRGSPCDCTCLCLPVPLPPLTPCAANSPNSVCKPLEVDSPSNPCNAESSPSTLLQHIASKKVSTVIIKSWIFAEESDATVLNAAGENAAQMLVDHLFANGFAGKAIISVPKRSALAYLTSAANKINSYPQYSSSVHFTIDGEGNDVDNTLQDLLSLPTKNLVYSTGTPAYLFLPVCVSNPFDITLTTHRLAAHNEARGVVGLSIVNTLDNPADIDKALYFFRGVTSNFPGLVHSKITTRGLKQATQCTVVSPASSYTVIQEADEHRCTPCTTIPPSTSSDIVENPSTLSCACAFHSTGLLSGGCRISTAAPANSACFCDSTNLLGILGNCVGSVVACKDPYSAQCTSPNTSQQACQQGGGNCNGY